MVYFFAAVAFALTSPITDPNKVCEYACYGKGVSPELCWDMSPKETKSFALVVTDETTSKTHWVIYNIPKESSCLQEDIPKEKMLQDGSIQEVNDFGGVGYAPLCPPFGEKHVYVCALYALDTMLPSGSLSDSISIFKKHCLDKTDLRISFERPLHKTAPNPPFHNPSKK